MMPALLHPHPLSHPHLHEIRSRSASGAGGRRVSTRCSRACLKSHAIDQVPPLNHLATVRFLAMTELGGTHTTNVLSQLPLWVVDLRLAFDMNRARGHRFHEAVVFVRV